MSVSSISNNSMYLPILANQAETNTDSNSQRYPEIVQLSDRAKSLLVEQTQKDQEAEKEETGKESVQVSSSIGRLSRVTGLQRDEVAALYRSIDKLT